MKLSLTQFEDFSDSGDTIEVSDAVFDCNYNESLVHQVIVACLARRRAGTSFQKNRSAVRGGGRKPFRQKGTGRARAGSIRSPLWRSGGVIFGGQTSNYDQKINKKMYRRAVCSILSRIVRENRLRVFNHFEIETPKTKVMAQKIAASEPTLIIVDQIQENLFLATRNLMHVNVIDVNGITPVDLVASGSIMVHHVALKKIEESLS